MTSSPPPLPETALSEAFLAGSGPGGQNVNKVATAVQLRLDVWALRLPPDVYVRLKGLAGARWTGAGEIVVVAREHRTREANRAAARARLEALLTEAWERPTPRAKTRLNRVGKTERLAKKSARGQVKRGRGKVELD